MVFAEKPAPVKVDRRGFARGDQAAIGFHVTPDRDLRDRFFDRDAGKLEIGVETDGDRHRIRASVGDGHADFQNSVGEPVASFRNRARKASWPSDPDASRIRAGWSRGRRSRPASNLDHFPERRRRQQSVNRNSVLVQTHRIETRIEPVMLSVRVKSIRHAVRPGREKRNAVQMPVSFSRRTDCRMGNGGYSAPRTSISQARLPMDGTIET